MNRFLISVKIEMNWKVDDEHWKKNTLNKLYKWGKLMQNNPDSHIFLLSGK